MLIVRTVGSRSRSSHFGDIVATARTGVMPFEPSAKALSAEDMSTRAGGGICDLFPTNWADLQVHC